MTDDFLKKVFEHLQSKLEDGESLYRLRACNCDGFMKLKDGNILIEIKGGELNWGYQCTAITELIIGSKLVRDRWNENANEHWIIAKAFTSGQGWDRTLDYPLETHRFIKDAIGFEIHLLQFKDGQLTEIVS